MNEGSFEQQFQMSYDDVLRLARRRLAAYRSPVSTTTLAHELYLNLHQRDDLNFATREQFLAYSSRAMRSLLIDMARERMAQKRSAELLPLTLGAEVPDLGGSPEQLVALDEALSRLGNLDARLMRVAEMRIIMGMESPRWPERWRCPSPPSSATGRRPRPICSRRSERKCE
jgi:DNA-directed RNA polymerase specialized sigma24 family protein